MKKWFKKSLAVIMTAVMLLVAIPMNFSSSAAEVNATSTDVTVSATNSFGQLLSDSLSEATVDPESPYYISDLVVVGKTATITYYNDAACTLVVAIYDENTGKMLDAVVKSIEAVSETANVSFSSAIPDNFLAIAFLLDSSNAALCKPYICNTYTTEFQEFISKTTADFNADKVINLDESTTNNFAVLPDDSVTADSTSKKNILISSDIETGTYVIEKADNIVKNLQPGDIFYLDNGDAENLLVIKISTVTLNGDIATIIASEASIEEIFEYVKIDSTSSSGDFMLDESTADKGVEYVGDVDYNTGAAVTPQGDIVTNAVDYEDTINISKVFNVNPKQALSAKITLKLAAKFKVYVGLNYQEIYLTVSPSVKIDATLKGENEAIDVKLGSLGASPVAGVYIGIEPTFVVKFSGSTTISGELIFTAGFGWNSDHGFNDKSKKPEFKPEVKAEISVFIGLDLKPHIKVVGGAAKAELSAEVGAEIKAVYCAVQNPDSGIKHDCDTCIDGDINGKLALSVKLILAEDTWLEKSWTADLIDISVKILDFYYSETHNKFGFSTCPYISYLLTFEIKNSSGKVVSGAAVLGVTSNSSGIATMYKPNGKVNYTVEADGYQSKSGTVEIKNMPRTVKIKLEPEPGVLTGKEKVGDIIRFGSYPQSRVTNSSLLSTLNKLTLNWVSYGYYSGNGEYGSMQPGDWMKYADVTYNGNKYRAVKFTKYRPYYVWWTTKTTNGFQKENGYNINTVYWFEYEPLEWRVLNPNTGLLMCEMIIDSQPFSNSVYTSSTGFYNDASHKNYLNDYATSSIRKWLINDFYNTTFNAIEKISLVTTELDNSAGSGSINRKSTNDKVFLLSLTEVTNPNYGFYASENYSSPYVPRLAESTDYANCQGLEAVTYYSEFTAGPDWLLRTPGDDSFDFIDNESINYIGGAGWLSESQKMGSSTKTYLGIRPAIRVVVGKSSKSSAVSVNSSAETKVELNSVNIPVVQGNTAAERNGIAGNGYIVLDMVGDTLTTDESLRFIDFVAADANGKINCSVNTAKNTQDSNTYLIGDFGSGVSVRLIKIGSAVKDMLTIKNPSVTVINYRDTLILHAVIDSLPVGANIEWTVDGNGVNLKPSEDGLTCEVTSVQNGEVTVTARLVDAAGEAITDADGSEIFASQQLDSKVNFWLKIISFFKNLFRISRIILQYN